MSGDDEGFNSKNWVWVPDPDACFVKGYITDYLDDGKCNITVTHDNKEEHRVIESKLIESCNPSKFNKCADMASLTHLNEPSVVYNLYLRYNDDMIYTYSGLFLVAINPYKALPIYDKKFLNKYHSQDHERPPPHIYGTAEGTYRNLLANRKDQSILVTGESGAGKTENTKKIIQYLSSITPDSHSLNSSIDSKILQANPILESFGNAKTIKNNNSSRFGKFIRVYFSNKGNITGADIAYYLLEKSRVVSQADSERNYHIFYQFLRGYDKGKLKALGLDSNIENYNYLNNTYIKIPQTDDAKDLAQLVEAFGILGLKSEDIDNIFSILAVILHLGNLEFSSWKSEQASFKSTTDLDKIADLLGVDANILLAYLLRPKVQAGREIVQKSRKAPEVKYAIDALARHFYLKLFEFIIKKINESLVTEDKEDDSNFIGVLDIAGFEIFKQNSFEQLCINYTNEKLQQFFNHHSFILEQSEYLREDIQWEFIDFGLDLQPTIDLIELKKPMGVLETLDEECLVPKATDKSFMEKLASTWNGNSKKFHQNKIKSGFIIDHYAGEVEYNVDQWLQKNSDPVSQDVLNLLPNSKSNFVQELFAETLEPQSNSRPGRKSKMKTSSQKYRCQLENLMEQLNSTEPHFVRCILPNLNKKPNKFDKRLVLNQLRCNGVLEGIRITRAGYPNRMSFDDFFSRYSIINTKEVFTKNGKTNSELLIKHINLEADAYKIGITKIFFKNGVLGKLEEMRDLSLKSLFTDIQSYVRGKSARSSIASRIREIQSSQTIAKNFQRIESSLNHNLWFKLFVNVKPLLEDSIKVFDSKEMNKSLIAVKDKLKEAEISQEALNNENMTLKDQINRLENEIISTTDLLKQKDEKLKQIRLDESDATKKAHTLQRDMDKLKLSFESLAASKKTLDDQLTKKTREYDDKHQQYLDVKDEHVSVSRLVDELRSTVDDQKVQINKHVNELSSLNANHERSISSTDQKVAELENARQLAEEALENFKSGEHTDLKTKNKSLEDQLSSYSLKGKNKEREIETYKEKVSKLQQELSESKLVLKEHEQKLRDLQSQLDLKSSQLQKVGTENKKLKEESDSFSRELNVTKESHKKLKDDLDSELSRKQELSDLKNKWTTASEENTSLQDSLKEIKVQLETSLSAKAQYSEEIVVLKRKIENLETAAKNRQEDSREKENIPPNPEIMEEFASIKLKMNEQSAILRKERFDNKNLSEEISLLKARIASTPKERSMRSPSPQKASRKEVQLKEMTEEIEGLKSRLQIEEANSQRAENFAINLQKKLNKLQSSQSELLKSQIDRGEQVIPSVSEIAHSLSERSIQGQTDNVFTRSDSLSRNLFLRVNNNQDFLSIYQDVTKTLKTTREELNSSKSEILRLKALLRESEENFYESKRTSFRSSLSEYENELTQLRSKSSSLGSKNYELEKSVELYRRRSEEYFEKLELAESAVNISKRHEQAANRELLEAKNQLTLAREEARTTQIVVKDMRKQIAKLDETLMDKKFELNQAHTQVKELQDKVNYYMKNSGSVEQAHKYKEEILSLHKELNFKLETETNLVKQSKKLQLDLEDLERVKDDLDKELEVTLNKLSDREDEVEDLTNRKHSLTEEKQSFERKVTGLNKQLNSLKELVKDVTDERDDLLDQRLKLNKKINDLSLEVEDKASRLQQSNSSLEVLREHLKNQRLESEEIRSELNQSKLSTSSEVQDYQKLRNDILVTSEENDSLKRTNKELNNKVQSLEDKLYSNEELKYWESKVDNLQRSLDTAYSDNHDYSKTITNLKREIKLMEIRVENEARLTKKYNDENFDYQNKVSRFKSTIDILHSENAEKDLQLKTKDRELSDIKENQLMLEKELLELRANI